MKKLYPRSIIIIISEMFFLAITLMCLVGLILGFVDGTFTKNWYQIFSVISIILVAIGSFIIFLSFISKKITIDNESITVAGDMADNRGLFLRRIQHRTTINYKDIENIYLHLSTRDSNNKTVKNVFVSMPYLVFACKNGQKKMINVYYFSKKQVINIIDIVKNKALYLGNDLQIETGKEIVSSFTHSK